MISFFWFPNQYYNIIFFFFFWNRSISTGTDGIGRALSQLIAICGGQVTIVGRTNRDAGAKNITFVQADLSSMALARACGESLDTDFQTIIFTNGMCDFHHQMLSFFTSVVQVD
jgi:hypothetical protein